jgi:hypothetical protein
MRFKTLGAAEKAVATNKTKVIKTISFFINTPPVFKGLITPYFLTL